MPVAKKPARRSDRQADHQVIKDLVRDLPNLIMQDSEQVEVPVSRPHTPRQPIMVHSDPRQRRWVWIGVTICTLAIGAFWVYNIRSLVASTFDGQSVEKDIARGTTQDLQALLNTIMINNEKLRLGAASTTAKTTSTVPTEDELRAALLAGLTTTSPNISTTTVTTSTN